MITHDPRNEILLWNPAEYDCFFFSLDKNYGLVDECFSVNLKKVWLSVSHKENERFASIKYLKVPTSPHVSEIFFPLLTMKFLLFIIALAAVYDIAYGMSQCKPGYRYLESRSPCYRIKYRLTFVSLSIMQTLKRIFQMIFAIRMLPRESA